jgi:hypothetical protein
MRMVYLSPVPWESFSQRPHRFVNWFHERTGKPVLWLDPYPTRLPRWQDLRQLQAHSATAPSHSPPEWLTVIKPNALPIEPIPGSRWLNRSLWQPALRAIDSFTLNHTTLLAIGKPSALALELLARLRHCMSLYDAMDDFPAFYSGLSRRALAEHERLIAQQADVIWVSSSELKARWCNLRDDVHLIHNGMAIPKVQTYPRESSRKLLGYVGTIATWFDWEWIHTLAEVRPNDDIRLIGPVFHPSQKNLPDNVELLPACDHGTAQKAMAEFNAALIPFRKTRLTASVDPIKYYEYRALSLPVISTDFGEMHCRQESPGVFISRSPADIAALAESALRFRHDPAATQSFIQNNSWEARFDAARLFP